MKEKDFVTNKNKKSKMINSEYGLISFFEWCKNEEKRIGEKRVKYNEFSDFCWLQRVEMIG